MSKTTITLTPDEVKEIITDVLKFSGYIVNKVDFKIDRGFPGSVDPRESQHPAFTGCDVVVDTVEKNL